MAIAGCSIAEAPRQDLVLDPLPDAQTWPPGAEQPRYAYAGVITGERDFIAPDDQTERKPVNLLAWSLGIVIGDPDYMSLERPVSGLVDELGRVLVVDASRHSVVVFDRLNRSVQEWKKIGQNEYFDTPIAIAMDRFGAFYVTDSERGEVIKLDIDGKPIKRFGGSVLKRPTGIAFDTIKDQLYVSDTRGHIIAVFDTDGNLIDLIGARGGKAGRLSSPTHLAMSDGRVIVADTNNFRVQVIDSDGNFELKFGEIGRFVGNMTRPKGVAVGAGGRIYVVESYHDYLLVFDKNGRFLMPIGGTGNTIGKFFLPNGVWTDNDGRVYVADMFNGRVVVFKELGFSGEGS